MSISKVLRQCVLAGLAVGAVKGGVEAIQAHKEKKKNKDTQKTSK